MAQNMAQDIAQNMEQNMEQTQSEIKDKLTRLFDDDIYRAILSKSAKNATGEYQKIIIFRKDNYFQLEMYTAKQVFHKNQSREEVINFCQSNLASNFLQLNAWSENFEYQMTISKKGKIFENRKKLQQDNAPQKRTGHNREKNYILTEGQIIPPLQDMGIFTAQGKIVAQMHDKFKQINRFLELIDDALRTYSYDENRPLKIVDFGCGKSYLTFVLYYYFVQIKKMKVHMIGLDLKEDVIEKCNLTAKKYGYDTLHFMVGDIGCYTDSVPADMVITLHACDTATDYALFHAIKWGARMIFSVPCCQHELNAQCAGDALPIISRYGIVKERTMALFTDSIRANLLEYCGYKTQLLEFVDFENTPKNLLIRAVRGSNPHKSVSEVTFAAQDAITEDTVAVTAQDAIAEDTVAVTAQDAIAEAAFKDNTTGVDTLKMKAKGVSKSQSRALKEVEELMETFHLNPTLYQLLKEGGYL